MCLDSLVIGISPGVVDEMSTAKKALQFISGYIDGHSLDNTKRLNDKLDEAEIILERIIEETVYYCNFVGHWPVGAALVVIATDKKDALKRALTLLEENDLLNKNNDLTEDNMIPISEDKILVDGNY